MRAHGTDQMSTSVRIETMTQRGPAVPIATSSPNGPPDTVKYEIAATPSTLSAGRALAAFVGSQAEWMCSASKPLLRPLERRPVASSSSTLSSSSPSTESTSASLMEVC
eukprot:scaffold4421_cov63-Phaeocystis_antarctica.AAC.3